MRGEARQGGMRIGPAFVSALVTAVVLVGCLAPDTPTSGTPGQGTPGPVGVLQIHAVAGPTCPVEREPPDPSCAPRPVAGARVVVTPADGREIAVAQGTTDERGVLVLELAPGQYLVGASEVEGFFGVPQAVPVDVTAGRTTSVLLAYDTGIR
jgi:hypothetical protein